MLSPLVESSTKTRWRPVNGMPFQVVYAVFAPNTLFRRAPPRLRCQPEGALCMLENAYPVLRW
jgi:hypothetical protein